VSWKERRKPVGAGTAGGSDTCDAIQMDSLINAAARALAAGDPLAALKLVALRNDAPGLGLRGIALAQLGEYVRARELLRDAARAFGSREALASARCVVAGAEVALAARDLGEVKSLDAARQVLERAGDHANATHARYLDIRRLLLLGRLADAEQRMQQVRAPLSPALQVTRELVIAHIAMRRLQASPARATLQRAMRLAFRCGIPALAAEVQASMDELAAPVARRIAGDEGRLLRLHEVEALLASRALVVDAFRHAVRQGQVVVSLAKRPVLLALARALAEAWPHDLPRAALIARAFRLKTADESHRARLRVEIGRLRKLLHGLADVVATPGGFMLRPRKAREVVVLARPVEEKHPAVLALLADGEAWSTSALALALGTGQRSVQRALESLAVVGKVHPLGSGRARRWTATSMPGFATLLLLPAELPTG
jgi:hypothetical protein